MSLRTLVYLDAACAAYYREHSGELNLSEIIRKYLIPRIISEPPEIPMPESADPDHAAWLRTRMEECQGRLKDLAGEEDRAERMKVFRMYCRIIAEMEKSG